MVTGEALAAIGTYLAVVVGESAGGRGGFGRTGTGCEIGVEGAGTLGQHGERLTCGTRGQERRNPGRQLVHLHDSAACASPSGGRNGQSPDEPSRFEISLHKKLKTLNPPKEGLWQARQARFGQVH